MVDYTANKHIEKPARGDDPGTWDVPVNADWDVIDQAFGGVTILSATISSTPVTLSYTQYRSLIIQISGQMNNNITFTIPSGVGGQWVVQNTTTDNVGGPWTVTIASGGGGSSVTANRGSNTIVFSDGTNIYVAGNVPSDNSVSTAKIQDGAVTYPKMNSAALATVAQYRSATASTLIPTDVAWSSAATVTLTDGSTITPDFSSGYNFSVTLNGSRTLANPTNIKVGQTGMIVTTAGSSGATIATFGSYWKFAGGIKPTFDTSSGAVNILSYAVYSSTDILVSGFTGVSS